MISQAKDIISRMTKLKFEEPDFDATFRLLYSPSRILQEVKKWHKSKTAQLSRQAAKAPDFILPDQLVIFYIGKEDTSKMYYIHKEVVYAHSPVLKAAFESNFIEGQTKTYRLEDTSEGAFRFLIQWFYSKKMNFATHDEFDDSRYSAFPKLPRSGGQPETDHDHYTLCHEQQLFLVELWILADKLLISELQNAVVDQLDRINRMCASEWPFPHLHYVYENTSQDSLLRRLLVYQGACSIDNEHFSSCAESFPLQFISDVAMKLCTMNSEDGRHDARYNNDVKEFYTEVDGTTVETLSKDPKWPWTYGLAVAPDIKGQVAAAIDRIEKKEKI